MIENFAVAAGAAVVTMIGTRWADTRRRLAEERSQLASELRVHLAEAHRRGNACARALKKAMEAENNAWLSEHGGTDRTIQDAISDFDGALESLREQASELLVRSDPSARRGVTDLITDALQSGERILGWLRHGMIPQDGRAKTGKTTRTTS
jgi:hypothetical protein